MAKFWAGNKYHNKKVMYNGVLYDSKKEAHRAYELELLQRAGAIHSLERQKKFCLLESFMNNKGEKIRGIDYITDFYYYDNDKKIWIAEDTKGILTPEFKLKKKLFEHRYADIFLLIS